MAEVMADIIRCRTEHDFFTQMEEVEYPRWVGETATVINYERSLYKELDVLPVVARLEHVKQLGMAAYLSSSVSATHTRYHHSLVLATQIDYLAQKLGLDRKLAVAAAMLHDIASPPLSDSVANAAGIKDEEYFLQVLEGCPEALAFLRRHQISKEDLNALVQGRDTSPLGQLVNSSDSIDVDRWSYVIADAWRLGKLKPAWRNHYTVIDPFKSASVVDGRIVFGDILEVREFLEARTQMYERVYRDESLRAKEAFMGVLIKDLLNLGMITKEGLLKLVDVEFEHLMRTKVGDLGWRLLEVNGQDDGFKSYGTVKADEETVRRRLGRLTKRPFMVKHHKPMKPATGTPILMDGSVKPYSEHEPAHSAELKLRMSWWDKTYVYGLEDDGDLESAVGKLKQELGTDDYVTFAPPLPVVPYPDC